MPERRHAWRRAALQRNAVATAGAAATLVLFAVAVGGGNVYPAAEVLAVCAVSYACGAYAPTVAGAAAVALLLAALELTYGISDDAWVPLVFLTLAPWLVGRIVRSREALVAALAERTRDLEAEQDAFARLAVRHERARIARELHDIVAHNLAVMVIHAGAGRIAPAEQSERAALRFSSIGEAGGQALAEMARLVDVLHVERAEPGDHRERLQLVLDRARAAGLNVRATPLPPGVELAPELEDIAQRTVQEGVTNALKHAPGAELDVRLGVHGGVLEVEVGDSGARAQTTLADTGAGLGITGLRERVATAGGQLDAAPVPGAGWRLRVRLPIARAGQPAAPLPPKG